MFAAWFGTMLPGKTYISVLGIYFAIIISTSQSFDNINIMRNFVVFPITRPVGIPSGTSHSKGLREDTSRGSNATIGIKCWLIPR